MMVSVRRLMRVFALICAIAAFSAFADGDELPKIAVYVAGGRDAGEDKAVMTLILAALVNSGRYEAVERSHDIVAQINREQETQRSGDVDNSQIMELGRQAGVQFVCVADLAAAFGAFQVSARIIDVETAKIIGVGVAGSDMKSITEMEILADKVVARMLGLKSGREESAAEKRMRERSEAEKRKKVETDRRKRAEARARDEDAIRKESEKADRVERRRREKAEKAEMRELDKKLAELGEGVRRIYTVGLQYGGLGNDYGVGGGPEGVLTVSENNGRKWEPHFDLRVGYYQFKLHNNEDAATVEATVFKGWTYMSDVGSNWQYVMNYGLTGCFGERYGIGLGGGGQVGIRYLLRFDEERDFLIFRLLDIGFMYRLVFEKKDSFTFTFTFGIGVAYPF